MKRVFNTFESFGVMFGAALVFGCFASTPADVGKFSAIGTGVGLLYVVFAEYWFYLVHTRKR